MSKIDRIIVFVPFFCSRVCVFGPSRSGYQQTLKQNGRPEGNRKGKSVPRMVFLQQVDGLFALTGILRPVSP